MKSFCIKTDNNAIVSFLLNNLSCLKFDDIYFIHKNFKIYENVIIHYKGDKINEFLNILSSILADCIICFYEPKLIKNILSYNYFYFDNFEKRIIEDICKNYILSNEDDLINYKKDIIKDCIFKYLNTNKSVILEGFIYFRLKDYLQVIDDIVDYSVNKYVVEKEYDEFISLLKLYIESKESQTDLLHLIYTNGESIVLDKSRNIISLTDNIINSKILSDISFSSNDYALNTLLSLLPEKIIVHIIGYEDEFINTLKLIFNSRIQICTDCNICTTYRVLNNTNKMN